MSTPTVNRRYGYYAKAHGETPEAMMLRDEQEWPGGCMTGFLLWMSRQFQEFKAAHPEAVLGQAVYDQDAWDVWLRDYN